MRINLDGPILRTLTLIFDVTVTTFLFLLCCLPVFTIGASLSAMYATMLAVVRDGCTGVIRSFFGAFRDNFKQATLLWLLAAAVGLVVAADIMVCWGFDMEAGMMLSVMQGLTVFCTALYAAVSTYVFSGIAVYRVTWKQAISNALYWTMKKLPATLALLLLCAVMVAAVAVLWFFAFPVIAIGLYLQAKLLDRILDLPREEPVHVDEEIYYGCLGGAP